MIVNTSFASGSPTLDDESNVDFSEAIVPVPETISSVVETEAVVTETEAAPVEVVQVDQPQGNLQPIDENRFWEEMKLVSVMTGLESQRRELEVELTEAKATVSQVEADLAEKRAAVKEIAGQVESVTDEFLDAARKLCQIAQGGAIPAMNAATSSESTAGDTSATDAVVTAQIDENGWRLHPTSDVLLKIPGAKGKKEKLIDLAPTVGHLQDLRVEASKDCKPFKAMMPKGCGEQFASAVETELIEFIMRWTKQQSGPSTKFADDLVAEIRQAAKQNGWTKEDCEPKETDNEFLRAGFLSFGQGRPYTDVIVGNEANAKQWMIGWVSGEIKSTAT